MTVHDCIETRKLKSQSVDLAPLNADDVFVHGAAHILQVGKDEGSPDVKPARYDVLAVFPSQSLRLVDLKVPAEIAALINGGGFDDMPLRMPPAVWMHLLHLLPQELLIVRKLNDQRDLERVLEVLREHEGDQVAQVKGLRRRTLQSLAVGLANAKLPFRGKARQGSSTRPVYRKNGMPCS